MKMRDPHKQISPWLLKAAFTEVFTASSKLQSAKIILGFFPPSSSDNFLNMGAAVFAIHSPVFVPPVKLMAGISGCDTIAAPTFGPRPCTIFKTPFGNPASMQSSASRNAVIGVISLGFAITQLPEASAGTIFQVNRYNGKFHGEIHPAIPTGWRSV